MPSTEPIVGSLTVAVMVCSIALKFATTATSLVTVKVNGLSVNVFSPTVQPTNSYPAFAVAVSVAVAPSSYVPAPSTLPIAASFTFATTVYSTTLKFATTSMSFMTVSVNGFSVMVSSPTVHPTNSYPALAVAVSVAVAPWLYTPAPSTLPIAGSLTVAVMVCSIALKFATTATSLVTVKVNGLSVNVFSPTVQPTNSYPALAVAVSVAVVPWLYTPAPSTLPIAASLTVAVTVCLIALKVATTATSLVTVKVNGLSVNVFSPTVQPTNS